MAALLLAFVNMKTAPLIEINNQKKVTDALNAVMPEAADFEDIEIKDDTVQSLYTAKDAQGNTIGVCGVAVTKGYDAGLTTAVGVDTEGKVTAIEIISHNETPGLGANAAKPEFKEQFKGKSAGIEISKTGARDNEIDAMSGATLTSRGVTNGVNAVLDMAAEILKEGK